MNRFQSLRRVCLLVVLTAMLVTPDILTPNITRAANNGDCVLTWTKVPVPATGAGYDSLNGIAAFSPNDVWAVGDTAPASLPAQTLIEHWNGTQWSIVPSPNSPGRDNSLDAVAVIAPDDVWAAGGLLQNDTPQTLIEHWNGSAWSILPSPNATDGTGTLVSIAGAAPNDVWAVGEANHSALLVHWDGSTWQTMTPPVSGSLVRVIAHATNDVWVLGNDTDYVATLLHWDGATWTIHSSFQLAYKLQDHGYFEAISDFYVTSANDVWVIGNYYGWNGDDHPRRWHWNGSTWDPVSGTGDNPFLKGIAGMASTSLWSVASYYDQSALAQWDGTAWQGYYMGYRFGKSILRAIVAVSPDEFWIVGADSSDNDAFIAHGALPCMTAPASAPTLVSPKPNEIVTIPHPTLTWQADSQAEYFVVQVFKGQITAEPYTQESTDTQISLPFSGPFENDTYFWRVRSCNYVACGAWSETASFVLQIPAPTQAPTLLTPENNSIPGTRDPEFEWNGVLDAETYNLQLWRNATDGQLILDENFSSTRIALDLSIINATYYWHVRACNGGGCGGWSDWFQFYLASPMVPKLRLPAKNAILAQATVRFLLSTAPFAHSYRFQLRHDSPTGELVEKVARGKPRWRKNLSNGRYVWQVKACDLFGCSPWSAWHSFSVRIAP